MVQTPAIDYTNRDYASLRQALLDLARYRLPEWTDRSPADLGVLMVDLFSYAADVVMYYQDRIANESFLGTAVERRSVMNLLRLIGYELAPPVAAATEVTLVFNPPKPAATTKVTVPSGAQFVTSGSGAPQTFEYLGPDLVIDLASDQVSRDPLDKKDLRTYAGLPVRHSRAVPTEVLGCSTGEPNQRFALSQQPVLLDTLDVEVDEGAGYVLWQQRASLLYNEGPDGRITLSSAVARDYYVQFDETDKAWIVFGDGVYGRRPAIGANNLRATYRVGGGVIGNVPRGAIAAAITKIDPLLASVKNPNPAAGGADHEALDHAVKFGPLSFRSGQRAVTLSDYTALANQAGGVSKVRAFLRGTNHVELYVAPEGERAGPVPEDLRRRLTAYFDDKRIVGTFLAVMDPITVPIAVKLTVEVSSNYRPDQVRQAVIDVVHDLYAYHNVDFGQTLYLSDLYARTDAVPGVAAVTVTRFRRFEDTIEVNPLGKIVLQPFEIPYLEEDDPGVSPDLVFQVAAALQGSA
jgi:Baseplate J-like protein